MFFLLPSLEDAGVWIRKRLLQTLSSAKCSALLAVGDSCRTLLPENNAKGTSDRVCPAPSDVLHSTSEPRSGSDRVKPGFHSSFVSPTPRMLLQSDRSWTVANIQDT